MPMTRTGWITGVVALGLIAGGWPAGAQDAPEAVAMLKLWDFETGVVGSPPAGFVFEQTGRGRAGRWVVRSMDDAPSGSKVAVQEEQDTENRYLVAVADAPVLGDVWVSVRCKPMSGKTAEACGLVFRYRDHDTYYVARASAGEDNIRLYCVLEGKAHQFAGWNGIVSPGVWHELAVEARADKLAVFWNGHPVLKAHDAGIGDAGKVGLWTNADSVTAFDDLMVEPLEPLAP